MDKRAALKAAAAVVAILILSGLVFLILAGLVFLAFDGRIWADVVLAVIVVGVFGYGFYDVFKD